MGGCEPTLGVPSLSRTVGGCVVQKLGVLGGVTKNITDTGTRIIS